MIAFGRSYDRIYTEIKRFSLYKIVGIPNSRGMIPHHKIKDYATSIFGDTLIQESSIPLSIISYDINLGEKIIFRDGLVSEALISSVSIPGIFSPQYQTTHLLMDGGIGNNLACEDAK